MRSEAGILEQLLREVEVRCRPRAIPDAINVDVSGLNVQEVLHVSDIAIPEGVTLLTPPETVVATVSVVREEPVEELTPEEEVSEPEVITKGKKEDEE